MSGFLGDALPQFILAAKDSRLNPVMIEFAVGLPPLLRESLWWPRSGFVGDFCAVDTTGILQSVWYEPPETSVGANSRYAITGITRDVYGTPLGGCTVKLFRTSTDEKVDQILSDPNNGTFTLYTPYYPDTHYLVAYLVGFPDTEGTTVNTLVGA